MAPAAAHSDPPSFYETLTSHTLGQEQRALLDLIDDLRSSSLSSDIELPQIVVVGDQSAGKSSVLTAITGVHFPRDAYACTRFPTEVRLRRAKDAGTMVQILPGKILPGTMRSEDEQRRLAGFRRCLEPGVELANLLNEATTLIESLGLSGKFASRDRLRVDCWGPDKGHLSFVDLPGLVKVSNNDQTDEDREAIEEIADEYMHSPRAIILAVIGGNSDYIQQTVLSKVKQFDPQGLRTLGVLTKPDLVASIGQEDKFLSLVNGAEHNFKLGWHVLLNADTNVVWSRKEREVHEKNFFSKGKWREVPEEKWGADRLWSRVSVQLSQQIARHIPSLLEDIEKELVKCEADLEALGVGCVTTEEMKSQLSNFFSASKFLIDEAVEGRYRNYRKGPKFFPITPASEGTPIQHLRARVVEENKCFVEKIETQGRKLTITEEEPPVLSNASDLAKQVSRKEYIRTVVDPMLEQNTGMEQEGDYNPSLIYRLFQDYSAMWDGLAKAHETDVEVLCRTFLEDVVHCVWPERMREPLWSHLLNKGIEEASKQAKEEVKRLVEDRELYVRAYDPAYSTRVKDWKKKQIEEKHVPSEGEVYLEKMLIYYDLTVKTFISNILTQVIERHLLQTLSNLFEIEKLIRMSEQTIHAIAAEDVASSQKRRQLQEKKTDIEKHRSRCKQIILRENIQIINTTNTNVHSSFGDGSPFTTTPHDLTSPQVSQETLAAAQASTSPNHEPPAPPNPSSSTTPKTTQATPLRPSRNSPAQVNDPAILTPDQPFARGATNGTISSTHTLKTRTSLSKPSNTSQSSVTALATTNGGHGSVHMSGFSPGPNPPSGGRSYGAGLRGVAGHGELGGGLSGAWG